MARPYDQAKVDRLRRLAQTHGLRGAATIAGVSERGVQMMNKRGWTVGQAGPAKRPIPTDFRIQSAHMTVHQMKLHYRAGLSTIARWSREIGREPIVPKHPGEKTIPGDLVERIRSVGPTRAARYYGVSDDTVLKWRRALGLPIRGEKVPAPAWGPRR